MDAEELLRVAGIFYYRSFLEFFFLGGREDGGGERMGGGLRMGGGEMGR